MVVPAQSLDDSLMVNLSSPADSHWVAVSSPAFLVTTTTWSATINDE